MTDTDTDSTTDGATTKPSVLFVCVHNAGRSQMAAGYLRHLSGGAVEVRSAGSMPADQINPAAVEAMLEEGIDIRAEKPKVLTTEAVQASDVVVTMGCGDAFSTAFAVHALRSGWRRDRLPAVDDLQEALAVAADFAAKQCLVEGAFGHGKGF